MLTIGQLNRIYELEDLLNNCVDDDKAILYERELEEVKQDEADNRRSAIKQK